MVPERASKHYKNFVDKFLFYQMLFENGGNLFDILHLPYPLFEDVILKQVAAKKKEKKELDNKLRNKSRTANHRKAPTKR